MKKIKFLFFLVLIFSFLWIHYPVDYYNLSNVSKEMFLSDSNKDPNQPSVNSVKTNNSRKRRATTSEDQYVSSIREVLINYRKIKIKNKVFDKKKYSWEHLTNYINSSSKTADIKKQYSNMSQQSQKELKALKNGNITHRILFNFLMGELELFFVKVRLNLGKLATIGVSEFDIGFKTYKMDVWKANYWPHQPFNFSVSHFTETKKARDQLIELHNINNVNDKLWTILEAKREAFWININQIVRKLGSINIINFESSWRYFSIKELFKERDKKFSEISFEAKTELIRLHEWRVTSDTMFKIYEKNLASASGLDLNELEVFNENIKGILSELGEIYIYNIDVNNKNYSWSSLVKQNGVGGMDIDRRYVAMSLKSQTELKLLYKIGMNHPKLSQLYKSKLNFFLDTIKPSLKKLVKLKILKFSFSVSASIFDITSLTANLDKKGSELTGPAKISLLSLYRFNKTVADFNEELNDNDNALKIKERLDKVLANKREVFRQSIQKVIKDLAKVRVNTISIQNGKSYSFIEMIKDNNIDKQYAKMTLSAQREFRILHENEITQTKLLKLYEDTLDSSLEDIKITLQLFADFGIDEITIDRKAYQISDLTNKLDVDGSKLTGKAKKQLLQLLANKINKEKLQTAYKKIIDPFLISIKPVLQILQAMGSKKATFDRTNYPISNLITNFEASNWETNTLASAELGALYKYNHHGPTVLSELRTAYKAILNSFLIDIKPALQVLKAMGSQKITIGITLYQIEHLITVLDQNSWETNNSARTELIALYKHNPNGSIVLSELEIAYKAILAPFLRSIKPALQVLKAMGSQDITVDGANHSINNLITVFKTDNWKTNILARTELITLYKHNPHGPTVLNKLQTAYKAILVPFLRSIKPILQSFKEIDSTQVIIVGVQTPFSITNLLSVLDQNNWETNFLASKELSALYKYNFNSAQVKEKLQTIYTDLIDSFLSIIEPTLQLFADFGIAEITIDKKSYLISDLTTNLDVDGSKLTGKAKKQLLQLLANKINKEKLIASLNDKLNSLFTILKPNLEEFLYLRITEIIIEDSFYSIGNLTANLNKKGSELTGDAKDELFALYKYNNDVYKLQNKLNYFLTKIIFTFQTNWDTEKVSTYLLWLPVFDIQKVKLSLNKILPVTALANAIKTMLTTEKLDFTKLEDKARTQLLSLLNAQGKLKEEKIFQDDVWRQIKNHSKWKAVEGWLGQSVLQSIRNLLLEIQDLEIKKIVHPFFPEGYDLSFLQDNSDWKTIAFKDLLEGMTIKKNGTNIKFYSHLFPNKVVFQVPMKKLDTIFSEITIVNILKSLQEAINVKLNSYKTDIQSSLNAYAKAKVNQFKIEDQTYHINHLIEDTNLNLVGSKLSQNAQIQLKTLLKNYISKQQLDETLVKILVLKEQQTQSTQDFKLKTLAIALSVVGGVLIAFSVLGCFIYWFVKNKH